MPINPKYKLGISSGFLIPGQNNVFSLTQKLANVITWGVNYTQIDIQSTAEISRQDFLPGIKHIVDSLHMKYGMHAEINESVGMDWAITQGWDPCHMKLNEYLDLLFDFYYDPETNKIQSGYTPDYIDFHITQAMAIPPRSTQNELILAPCTTPWGRGNWDKYIFTPNPHLKKWFMLNILRFLYERQAAVHRAYETAKLEWMYRILEKIFPISEEGIKGLGRSGKNAEDALLEAFNKTVEEIDNRLSNPRGFTPAEMNKMKLDRLDYLNKMKRLELRKQMREHLEKALDYFEGKGVTVGPKAPSAAERFEENGTIGDTFEKALFGMFDQFNKDEENITEDEDDEDEIDFNNITDINDIPIKGFLVDLYRKWLDSTVKQNYRGTIVGEQYAYAIIGKYLNFIWKNNHGSNYDIKNANKGYDIFWEYFIRRGDNFNGETFDSHTRNWDMSNLEDNMSPRNRNREKIENVKMVQPDGTVNLHADFVSMVASFYIAMHFDTPMGETDQYHEYQDYLKRKGLVRTDRYARIYNDFHELKPIEKLHILGIKIAFENPHLLQSLRIPGTQRIVKAVDMEKFARCCQKLFDGKESSDAYALEIKRGNGEVVAKRIKNNLYLLLDFGWWQANGMDPVDQVKTGSSEFGKYVKAIQIHYAYAGGAHYTIDIGSTTHIRMYEWLYELQKRKLGADEPVPVVFERGGGNNPLEVVRTSVFAMRTIAKMLEQNQAPTPLDLPKEFFGVGDDNLYSTDRQMVVIKEHAFDPVKGMLEIKEFEHGFVGGHAISKGKRPEDYAKEKLK